MIHLAEFNRQDNLPLGRKLCIHEGKILPYSGLVKLLALSSFPIKRADIAAGSDPLRNSVEQNSQPSSALRKGSQGRPNG